ncbi:MAG: zinc-dependent metalloprotease [Bacteroidales bacterium]|nr:zinc-dependent metalloprotease [Bacteroidales bacterium]
MKRTAIALLALTVCVSGLAQPKGPRPASPGDKEKTDEKKEAPALNLTFSEGLFGAAQNEKDWYLEIPDSLLERRFLAVTRYVSNTVGAGVYGGEEVNEAMLYWEKASNGNLLLRSDVLGIVAPKDDIIAEAVRVSSENPIVASFKPEKGASAGTTRIKANSLFEGDTQVFSLDSRSKKQYNLGGVKADASFIQSIRSFPINTEVTVTKTYSYNQPSGAPGASGPRSITLPAGRESGFVTVVLNTSMILLPREPMQQRYFDPRVGYFANGYSLFTDEQQGVQNIRFITRWRLEARPEDVERQKRGELVEPVKPIVYYIDPATPKQWVPYLMAGVNDWNAAFEQAGWKNAIRAEEWPQNADELGMSLEDARFSVIRYLASPIANAYGPNVHDPRSGEILESHIGWYHNVMTLVHDWYQIQASAIDPRARAFKYDEELMGDLIRFVSSHEVGHTLGLRHNKGSSSFTPVEKLRDKEWVEKNGHTVSIMDYARFNYVAQPEDGIGKEGIYPRINLYDKWAIEYGYKPTYIDNPKEDHLWWNKEIIARLKAEPRLWFGGEGYDEDPRAQSEDLGDDAVAAGDYGIANLQRIIGQLPEWNSEEANMFTNLGRMYSALVQQYGRYMGHVAMNVGGRYITNLSVEQEGVKYAPVPKERQKDALNFLNRRLFQKPSWMVEQPYIFNLSDHAEAQYLYPLINSVVSAGSLLSLTKLDRMASFAQASSDNYSPEEYLQDLHKMIFSELDKGGKVTSYRRYLQTRFVTVALDVVKADRSKTSPGRALLMGEILSIQKAASKAKSSDTATYAHWQTLAKQIENALD